MSKKYLTIIYISAFALLIALAALSYNYATSDSAPETVQEPPSLQQQDAEIKTDDEKEEEMQTPEQGSGGKVNVSKKDDTTSSKEDESVLKPQPLDNSENQQRQETEKPIEPQQKDEKKNANPAPDFTAINSGGSEVKLSAKFGKPIVLNFWASWCPPCKNEFPHFQSAYNKYKDKVEFVLVDLVDGQRETVDNGKAFISQNNYTMPIYFDVKQSAAYAYRISSIPATYFIDKDGDIVNLYRGQMSEKNLFSAIDALLDGGEQ